MASEISQDQAHGEILVVEDNPASLKLLSDILTDAGFKVRPATDGQIALLSLEARLPDLVLMDFKLPGLNGIEVCQRIISNPVSRDIPVVFISALTQKELQVQALEAGGVDYVTKPFDPPELLARVRTHLNLARMRKQLAAQTLELQQYSENLEELVARRTAEVVESQANTLALVNATTEVVLLLDRDGTIILSNQTFADSMDTSTEELVGRNAIDWAKPEVANRRLEVFKQILAEKKPRRFFDENRGKVFDNSLYPILDKRGNVRMVAVYAQDITERKKMEDKLELETNLSSTLIEALPYPTMLIKKDRTVVFANKVARQVGAVVGGTCWEDFGQSEYISDEAKVYINQHQGKPPCGTHCTFCLADTALDEGFSAVAPEIQAFGRIWETHWVPVGEDVYLHYSLDITERKEAEGKILASLKEKEVLLREIHHRVKNNMQVIVSLLRIHARRSNSDKVQAVFNECRDRVNAMALIHEALYESDDVARIDFQNYLEKLAANLSRAHRQPDNEVDVVVSECTVELGMDQSVAVGMVVCELVSNSFKHAFGKGGGGQVQLSISALPGDEVELIVQDDGIGLPADVDIHNPTTVGLDLAISAVTGELGGKVEVSRDSGTRYQIRFKYKWIDEKRS